MTENLLVSAMKDSLVDEWEGTVADLMECSIDSILKDGVLKDIPVVGIAMSVCKTGLLIREKHFMKELLLFIKALNSDQVSREKILEHKRMLDLNPKRAEKELEGIILILDTHIADAQSVRLGYFYKAYIIKEISWEQFEELKQVNQRIFEEDVKVLINLLKEEKVKENYRAFRLIGLGLAAERQIGYADGVLNLTTDEYEITELGRIFLKYMKE